MWAARELFADEIMQEGASRLRAVLRAAQELSDDGTMAEEWRCARCVPEHSCAAERWPLVVPLDALDAFSAVLDDLVDDRREKKEMAQRDPSQAASGFVGPSRANGKSLWED